MLLCNNLYLCVVVSVVMATAESVCFTKENVLNVSRDPYILSYFLKSSLLTQNLSTCALISFLELEITRNF